MRRATLGLVAALACLAGTARAQEAERFCPNRPSLSSTGCTVAPGRVLVEASGIDWQRSDSGRAFEDELLLGDAAVRVGIADHAEAQIGWTAYGRTRTRGATGGVSTESGVGDLRLGLRRNLINPDGDALSIAVEPFVVLPVGGAAIGDGTWSAGVSVPVNRALAEGWTLNVTGQIEAAADADRRGRHLSLFGVIGIAHDLVEAVNISGEIAALREEDRADRRTETVAALSVAWQPRDRLQLDLLAVAGLSRAAPDLQLVAGGAILF